MNRLAHLKSFYQRYARWMPILGFACGFIFDMMMLHRIDEPSVILQQALYLVIAGTFISLDLISTVNPIEPPFLLRKIWKYREFLLHFFLGTLMNSYTIFYFKSAAGTTSFIFIVLLGAALILSEFKSFGKSQQKVHMALWSLCLVSYFQSLLPILLGVIGLTVFLASSSVCVLVFSLYYKMMKAKLSQYPLLLRTHILYPYVVIHAIFAALYFSHAIPPVPLSVSYMGIYHQAEKKDGKYILGYTRSWTSFWQHGDETFFARPGDTVIAYVQIFAPSGFRDHLNMRWLLRDQSKEWQSQDLIPLTITGGRDEGFRVAIKKNNYQAGDWRVQIETQDEHTVGRLNFKIVSDESTDERTIQFDEK